MTFNESRNYKNRIRHKKANKMNNSMYSEVILDYYRNPPNKGTIAKPDAVATDVNTACGDEIEVQLKVDKKGKISEAKFNGKGCIVSQASASMLLEYIHGKTLEEVEKLTEEKALGLLCIKLTPIRTKCGLLGFKTLKKTLTNLKKIT